MNRRRRRTVALIAVVAMVLGGCALAGTADPATTAVTCITDTNLAPILATIRHLESDGHYELPPNRGGASGAYQFVNPTWNGFGGYTRAGDAPPDVQDAKAAQMVTTILNGSGNQVDAVPVAWYWPIALTNPPQLDIVPMPNAGNTLTVRQYQTKWMGVYRSILAGSLVSPAQCAATPAPTGPAGPLPRQLACSTITWRGQANAYIPTRLMTYTKVTGYAHPAAAASWTQIAAAANALGYDVAGSSYRAAKDEAILLAAGTGVPVGRSCHGLGLAIDINVLVPCGKCKYKTADAAFAGPEYTWLCANAANYGWINPDWAHPAGTSCTGNIGTGHGGGRAHVLEPWHFEDALVATTHPDFAP